MLDQVHKFPHVGKILHLFPKCTGQCTLPRTFTYRACPFSVHCLSFNALPAEIRTRNHAISRSAHYPLHHSVGKILHLFQNVTRKEMAIAMEVIKLRKVAGPFEACAEMICASRFWIGGTFLPKF